EAGVPRYPAAEHSEEAEAAVPRARPLRVPRLERRRLHRRALLRAGARETAVPERRGLPAVLEEGAGRAAGRHQPAREPGVHPAALDRAPAPLLRRPRVPAPRGEVEPLPRDRRPDTRAGGAPELTSAAAAHRSMRAQRAPHGGVTN